MILIQQYKLFIWFRFCKVIHMCKKLRGVNDTAELKMIYVIFSKIFQRQFQPFFMIKTNLGPWFMG